MNIVLNVIVNAEPIDGCCGASSAEWYTGAVWLGEASGRRVESLFAFQPSNGTQACSAPLDSWLACQTLSRDTETKLKLHCFNNLLLSHFLRVKGCGSVPTSKTGRLLSRVVMTDKHQLA